MNARIAILIAVIMGSCSALHAKEDKKVVYVGDGRYQCQGSGCGKFNAEERGRQEARKYRSSSYGGGYNEFSERRSRERNSFSGYDRFSPREDRY